MTAASGGAPSSASHSYHESAHTNHMEMLNYKSTPVTRFGASLFIYAFATLSHPALPHRITVNTAFSPVNGGWSRAE